MNTTRLPCVQSKSLIAKLTCIKYKRTLNLPLTINTREKPFWFPVLSEQFGHKPVIATGYSS